MRWTAPGIVIPKDQLLTVVGVDDRACNWCLGLSQDGKVLCIALHHDPFCTSMNDSVFELLVAPAR